MFRLKCVILAVVSSFCLGIQRFENDPHYFQKTIRMPDAVSDRTDALLCHAVRLNETEAYILKYEPHATKTVAHHMMVYGCGTPGSHKPFWTCGEMDDRSDKSVCSSGAREIVWAWANNADARDLPEGTGFRVGGTTGIKYLVIQLHYKQRFTVGQTDKSGVTLHMTYTPQPRQTGYYVLGNSGYIPPMVDEFHMETVCMYARKYEIYPIAFRTHSHNLGVVTAGYRFRNNEWTEIGRMSPQLPQTFYNTSHNGMDIKEGDVLASRCTMSSQRNEYTIIGPTNRDEMCNFYILYYTYHKEDIHIQYCFKDAQSFKWPPELQSLPDKASSTQDLPHFERIDPYAIGKPKPRVRGVAGLM